MEILFFARIQEHGNKIVLIGSLEDDSPVVKSEGSLLLL